MPWQLLSIDAKCHGDAVHGVTLVVHFEAYLPLSRGALVVSTEILQSFIVKRNFIGDQPVKFAHLY